ncbi:Oidioi.mRNA.OKI2018_I69.chr2.g4281.t2.cds [Oikopleura dioica]|uniref:Palmitoyltransferase n=1 Tax=Oikopleura dioica TaxID=34765 RepID=A0ABN7SXA9_OIKDI|nr:Oidioi.mRNA.OKI2018_I69.chr2.g4281.t2.cds [Oikopleura dioica]
MKVKPENKQENPPRKNGFHCPLDPKQVSLWIVFFIFVTYTFILVIPVFNLWYIPFSFEALAVICFVFFTLRTTWIDPADFSVRYQSGDRPQFKKTKDNPHVIRNLYCQICKINVDNRTKHCRNCNKCISVFDHHCDWLNTCVGVRNYRYFIATLISAQVMLFLTFLLNLLAVVGLSVESRPMLVDSHPILTGTELGVLITSSIICVLILVMLFFVGQLFVFHLKLIKNDQTTYDYIIAKRKLKEQREKEAKENAAQKAQDNQAFEVCSEPGGLPDEDEIMDSFEEKKKRVKSATTVATISDVRMDHPASET